MKRRAFSLTESIMGLFLLSLLVLFVFNLLPSSLASVRRSDEALQADELAESILASHRRQVFQSPLGPQPLALSDPTFQAQLETFSLPARDANWLRGLRVTVRWKVRNVERSTVHELWECRVQR